ncbi:MAG: IS1 family transposase [Bacteroidetes bacterium]|nr:IS1 family transposase [Bacteroidota bacterium]
MDCQHCGKVCQKWGRQKNGSQRFYCKVCKKCQQKKYCYTACKSGVVCMIPRLVCNSVGIRGIARVLKIAVNTVVKQIKRVAEQIAKPPIPLNRQSFEIDELRTYIGKKENQYWVAYVLCSETKQVIDFIVGKRSKRTLRMLVNTALLSGVAAIKTDRLNIYQALIPAKLHISNAYNINYIERHNLNLRTHLKRLGRRTICFSKNTVMLTACLRIYFWYAA